MVKEINTVQNHYSSKKFQYTLSLTKLNLALKCHFPFCFLLISLNVFDNNPLLLKVFKYRPSNAQVLSF
jgi:hypothetical protein